MLDGLALVIDIQFAHGTVGRLDLSIGTVVRQRGAQVVHLCGSRGEGRIDLLIQHRFLGAFHRKRAFGRHRERHLVGREQDQRGHRLLFQRQVIDIRRVAGQLHLIVEMAVVVGPDGIDRLETVVVELLQDDGLVAGAFDSRHDPGDRMLDAGCQQQPGADPENPSFHGHVKRFAG